MQSRPALALSLRVLLVAVLLAASVVTIVTAWGEAGGAPLNVILGCVLLVTVFAAGGLAFRSSSRLVWWGALAVLWLVLLRGTPSAEYLALPLIAMAAATEPVMYALIAAVAVVALASALGASGVAAVSTGIFVVGVVVAVLAGLGYRRLVAAAA